MTMTPSAPVQFYQITTTFIGPFHPVLPRHNLPPTSHCNCTRTIKPHTVLLSSTSPLIPPRRLRHSSMMTTAPSPASSNGTVGNHSNPNVDTTTTTHSNTSKNTISLRTCRQCKKSYDPAKNNPTACRYHSGIYTGDSKRKGGVSDDGYSTGDGAVERFWW